MTALFMSSSKVNFSRDQSAEAPEGGREGGREEGRNKERKGECVSVCPYSSSLLA
jgi:hypothetical protein